MIFTSDITDSFHRISPTTTYAMNWKGKTEEEFWAWDGRGEAPTTSVNEVKDVPEAFKDWVSDNSERIAKAEQRGTLPYFIRDNRNLVNGIRNSGASPIKLTDEQKAYRKQLQNDAIKQFKGTIVNNVVDVNITAKGIKEFLNQPFFAYFEKNELVKDLPTLIKRAKYFKRIGYHKANHDVVASHLFKTKVKGQTCYLIAREARSGAINFYSISDGDIN